MIGDVRRREEGLDAARGVGILLVIVAHALEAQFLARPDGVFFTPSFRVWQAIYAFHMPLFFLLSGAANRDLASKPTREVVRGSIRLVLLAWACQIVGAVLAIALGRVAPEPAAVFEAVVRPILVGHDWSTAVTWFLVSLAVVRLLVHGLASGRGTAVLLASAGLAVGIWALVDPSVPNLQMVKTWLPGVLFFGLGVALGREPRRLPHPILGAALLTVAVAIAPLNLGCRWSPTANCGYDELAGHAAVVMVGGVYGNLPLALVTALLGAVGAWSVVARLRPPGAAALGRHSLELFILNGFVLTFVGPVMKVVPVEGTMGPLLQAAWVLGALPLHIALRRLVGGVPVGLIEGSWRLADRLTTSRRHLVAE